MYIYTVKLKCVDSEIDEHVYFHFHYRQLLLNLGNFKYANAKKKKKETQFPSIVWYYTI